VQRILLAHDLVVYDVEEIPTHGGSLRVYARHKNNEQLPVSLAVGELLKREINSKLDDKAGYQGIQEAADRIRDVALQFLVNHKQSGCRIVGYGAAAKGNTFLNYCGIKGTSLIEYVVDANTHKQGLFLPGSHIPVVSDDRIHETRPEFVIILPWNIADEVMVQLAYIREWGGKFVTFIPTIQIR